MEENAEHNFDFSQRATHFQAYLTARSRYILTPPSETAPTNSLQYFYHIFGNLFDQVKSSTDPVDQTIKNLILQLGQTIPESDPIKNPCKAKLIKEKTHD